MAKKKAASAASETATVTKKTATKVATKSSSNGSTSNGSAATASTVLGTDQIGLTAGSVWLYLSDNGATSLAALKKEIGGSADLVLAAIGWLAREEKLDFMVSGKTIKIALK
jgi:hypothetical protein